MLNDGGIGKKDSNQYLFSIWENIFCTPKSSISSRVGKHKKNLDSFDIAKKHNNRGSRQICR